jgi:hypothetical protein
VAVGWKTQHSPFRHPMMPPESSAHTSHTTVGRAVPGLHELGPEPYVQGQMRGLANTGAALATSIAAMSTPRDYHHKAPHQRATSSPYAPHRSVCAHCSESREDGATSEKSNIYELQ